MSTGTKASEDPYALTDEAIQAPPTSLWKALFKIGPGIVLAGSIVGSGELILTTSLGADWGFIFLWLVLFSCVIKVFVQIELGRYAISSGEPTLTALDRLPGLRLGTHWLVWWWFIMLLITVFQLGAMVGLVGQALNMAFPDVSPAVANGLGTVSSTLANAVRDRPEHPWAIATALTAIVLLLSGGYKRIETITTTLVAGVTLVTVISVGMLAFTDYPVRLTDIADGFSAKVFTLQASDRALALAAAFATFGITGVGASELYSYPYWCLEKGYGRSTGPRSNDPAWAERAKGWLRVMILDAWVSMVVFTVATVAFYILGATILHRRDLHPKGPAMIIQLAEMYVPVFGAWTKVFFMIAAWAVLFKTLYVASAGHARLSTDFLGLTHLVKFDQRSTRPLWINRFCVFFPSLALVLYFVMRDPKIMVVIGGYAQAVTLPIISGAALYLRYFRTDKRLAPSWVSDILLWTAFILITAFSIYATYGAIGDAWTAIQKWAAPAASP
jgi:Mn2+/Fe2+ NRAMP family transporter